MRNRYLIEVKNKILNRLMLLSSVALFLTSLINLFNKRPLVNILFPIIGATIILTMFIFHSKHKYMDLIRYVYILFSCIVYFPLAFLTSPGTYSAMAFYSVVFFFISTILVYRPWEYIFPISNFIIAQILFYHEGIHPEKFNLYTTPPLRAFDLGLNFFVVGTVIALTIHILNRYFQNEHERIFDVSMTDPLTGIYNRRYLYQMLEQFSANLSQVPAPQYTLLMMDLNHFKKINDLYGHSEGDLVLKAFSETLKISCRKNDIPIRYGGDEFILILVGAHLEEAKQVEKRIVELFDPLCAKYPDVPLSVSFGYAESNKGHLDDIIKTADDLLYKNKGKIKGTS